MSAGGSGRRPRGAGVDGPGPLRIIATSASALVCATLPMFLLGALAPRIIADLDLDEVAIGGAVALFFLAAAISAVPGGRLTDRIGASAALRASVTVSACSAIGIAALGRSYLALLLLLVVAGAAVPLADTGGARAIAAGVPVARQGIAFGGKEASIPVASLLAGLAVPVLGAQFGWRPAFAVAGTLALIAVAAVPARLDQARAVPTVPDAAASPSSPAPDVGDAATAGNRAALLLLAVAAGLGGGAANSAPTFLVASSVSAGMLESRAGLLLAVASAAGIGSRLMSGLLADRRPGSELSMTAALMAIGSVGMLSLAYGSPTVAVMGAILALGGGWGWTGLAFLGAIRLVPDRPARAAGAVLAGLASGGALGPLGFGALAAGPGYGAAWLAAGIAMVVAASLAWLAARFSSRHRQVQAG